MLEIGYSFLKFSLEFMIYRLRWGWRYGYSSVVFWFWVSFYLGEGFWFCLYFGLFVISFFCVGSCVLGLGFFIGGSRRCLVGRFWIVSGVEFVELGFFY